MHAACLIYDDELAQLDHLASLASLLNISLIVTDSSLYGIAKEFYPFTKLKLIEDPNGLLKTLASFDLIFVSCKHFANEISLSLKRLFGSSPRFCYCPHGNSDKGWSSQAEDLLRNQDLSLVYGDLMRENLEAKGVLSTLKGTFTSGNYRVMYYQKHKSFYDSYAQRLIFSKLNPNKLTLLYTPTWQDKERNSSFCNITPTLCNHLTSNINLLIKFHPKLEKEQPEYMIYFEELASRNSSICIIKDFPPIYPILNKVNALLSDVSSIGYDFLYFNRPLYLLTPQQFDPMFSSSLLLLDCARAISLEHVPNFLDSLPTWIKEDKPAFEKKREMLYGKTFDAAAISQDFATTLLTTIQSHLYAV